MMRSIVLPQHNVGRILHGMTKVGVIEELPALNRGELRPDLTPSPIDPRGRGQLLQNCALVGTMVRNSIASESLEDRDPSSDTRTRPLALAASCKPRTVHRASAAMITDSILSHPISLRL